MNTSKFSCLTGDASLRSQETCSKRMSLRHGCILLPCSIFQDLEVAGLALLQLLTCGVACQPRRFAITVLNANYNTIACR